MVLEPQKIQVIQETKTRREYVFDIASSTKNAAEVFPKVRKRSQKCERVPKSTLEEGPGTWKSAKMTKDSAKLTSDCI